MGRAEDALLAVHLFGLNVVPTEGQGRVLQYDTGKIVKDSAYASQGQPLRAEVPYYSTSWEGMGLVVEAMHRQERGGGDNFYLLLQYNGAGWSGNYYSWAASFWLMIDDQRDWTGNPFEFPASAGADAAPMAVALAALRALGVEVPT